MPIFHFLHVRCRLYISALHHRGDARVLTGTRMKSLSGKTALVTGAGSGLGREIALLMASEGASVGIADLSLASAGKVVREIQLAGGEALAIGMDVPDEQQTQEGIDALVSRYGSLDILVSNRMRA